MKNVEKSVLQLSQISKEEIAKKRRLENAILDSVDSNMPPQLISREKLARHFNVTVRTLLNWEIKGLLSRVKIGGKVFYELKEVIALQRQNKNNINPKK